MIADNVLLALAAQYAPTAEHQTPHPIHTMAMASYNGDHEAMHILLDLLKEEGIISDDSQEIVLPATPKSLPKETVTNQSGTKRKPTRRTART